MSKAKAKAAAPAARRAADHPTMSPIPPTRPATAAERAERGERGFTDTPPASTAEHTFTPRVPDRTATGALIKHPRGRTRKPIDEGPPRHLGPLMRVEATQVGFIDNVRRRTGDVFDVHEAEFSENWMTPVDGDTPTLITGPAAALKRVHDETLTGRQAGRTQTAAGDPLGAEARGPRA